jgi:hypothetical protein
MKRKEKKGKKERTIIALVAWLSGPQEQKTRVRIPPWCKVFKEVIALRLCIIDY